MSPTAVSPEPASPWPRRLVLAAAAVLVPLFLFGGTVTTIGAGLAVDGWWNAEGHFMPLFPIESWFRDLNTFVEHSHRQFGMVIGLLMLAACVATWRTDRRRSARVLVVATTLAICVQGWLGGSRVLERSSELAFLHGAFAQAVFALLVVTAAHQSRAWRAGPAAGSGAEDAAGDRRLRRTAVAATALVYLQVVVGAWYRHGLRNALGEGVQARLALHVGLAVVVLGAVARLAALLAERRGVAPVDRVRRGLVAALLAQVLLGALAWATHDPRRVGLAEWAFATLHVLVGATLLAHCVLAALWAGRGHAARTAAPPRPVEVPA